MNDVDSSSTVLEMIHRESNAIGYRLGMATYILTKGVNLYNSNRFEDALKITYDGEKLVLGTHDNGKIAHLYALRGNCYNNLFYFDKSQECLLVAKSYAEQILDDNSRFSSLGRIYRIMAANFNKDKRAKNIDSVLYYQKKSYLIQSRITDGSNHAGMIIQGAAIGLLFSQTGQEDSAKHYFSNSLQRAKTHKLSKFAVEAMLGLGHLHYKAARLDSALGYYIRALPLAQKNNNANNIKVAYKSLAQTYEQLGNAVKAGDYYKKYALLTDSILQANRAAVTVPGEFIVNERENKLANENKLRNIYLVFAIVVAILAILIVIVLYNNINISRRNNTALSTVNKQMSSHNLYLHNTLEALEKSSEENNRLVQIISHDLRSPMAAIVGLSDFIITEGRLSGDELEAVQLINTSGNDSLKFIGDILNNRKGLEELKTETVDLQELLGYCILQCQYKAKEKAQQITFKGGSLVIDLNREKIWRVINNLISNAIKFSPDRAIIRVSLEKKTDTAQITVQDKGIGIPAHLKDQIFLPGKKGNRSGTNGEGSFGLGLAISKQIVEEHGGTLSFESIENEGTSFFISLPI